MNDDTGTQLPRLRRLCVRHWFSLMGASMADGIPSDSGVDSTNARLVVLEKALACPRCRERNGLVVATTEGGVGPQWNPTSVEATTLADDAHPVRHGRVVHGVGWAIGAIAVLAVILATWAILNSGTRLSALDVGDCVQEPPGVRDNEVDVVECSARHTDEVYARFRPPGQSWPLIQQLSVLADRGCHDRFEEYVGVSADVTNLDWWTIYPLEPDRSEDRVIVCFVYDGQGQRTGSLRNSRR